MYLHYILSYDNYVYVEIMIIILFYLFVKLTFVGYFHFKIT